jgi:hypothetical protein
VLHQIHEFAGRPAIFVEPICGGAAGAKSVWLNLNLFFVDLELMDLWQIGSKMLFDPNN